MDIINITDFKQNIWTYFDSLISTKEPIFIQRRKHKAMVLPLDNLTNDEINIISRIWKNRNMWYVEVTDKEWVSTFNKISWSNLDKVNLG